MLRSPNLVPAVEKCDFTVFRHIPAILLPDRL